MKRVLMLLVCSLAWWSPAQAQTCMGSVPFATAPLQAGAAVGFSSNTHTFLGGVAKGTEKWFGRGGAELTSYSFDASAKGFYGSAGTEKALGADKHIMACPMVGLLKTWGPKPGPDFNHSTFIVNFGGSVGFEATTSGNMRVVPTAGLDIDIMRDTFKGDGFLGTFSESTHETFANLVLGVGLIFNDRMSLVPSLVIPFGLDGSETAFAVRFTTALR